MADYDWACLACGHKNSSSIDECAECGCPSTANANTIEEFRDPKAYAESKEKEGFEKVIALIVFIPVWTLLYALKGNILFGFLLVVTAATVASKEREVIQYIISDSWGRLVISIHLAVIAGFIIFRLVTGNEIGDKFLISSILIFITVNLGLFYYTFKSDNAKAFYERYKKYKLTRCSS